MIFLRPEFLYGLFALAIPVIIHLFNFRKHKKLFFSDISRLKNITIHTRKQQKLKHIIVLALRMLAILLIVFAFAGPEIKNDRRSITSGSRNVALYIDNSFSMMAEGFNGRLFENARQDALQLINHSADNTSFMVLSNNNNGQLNRILGKESAASEIEKMEISSSTKKLSQIITARNRIIQNHKLVNCDTYIFSDFQKNSSDISNLPVDSINNYFLVPFEHLQNKNIYIDSCSIDNPDLMIDKVIELTVWIKNDSDTDYEKVPLKLIINDQQKAVAGIDIKAGSSKQVKLNFTTTQPGWQHGLVELEDFPITFDDKMYFAFFVEQNIEVLIIGSQGDNTYLRKFYNSDDIFKISEMNYRMIDYEKLSIFDVIILNELPDISSGLISQTKQYIMDGGNILFIPSGPNSINKNSSFLSEMKAGEIVGFDTTETRVSRIKLSNNLFSESIRNVPQNADLPIVKQHYVYNFPINSGVETLISLLSGNDFLSKKNIGAGQLYLLSSGLNTRNGNFASHLLFVPVMHGVASKRGATQKLFYTLGKTSSINFSTGNFVPSESPFSLYNPITKQSLIPVQTHKNGKLNLSLNNIVLQNGYYNLTESDSLIGVFALNYNRDESEIEYFSIEQLSELCKNSNISSYSILDVSDPKYTEVINALQKESDFWKLFIIFALFVILIEILILRFWK